MTSRAEILKKYWGYDHFRPLQEEIVQSVLDGHPTMALLPTGGGKSICFQVPAMAMEGICVVISPLIALMKDQVQQLQKRNIKAKAIYAGMSLREIDITLDNCVYGDIKFLYVSPERVKTSLFLDRVERMNVSLIAIDEAHCISQWGYDFRPSYLELSSLLSLCPDANVIALTASATEAVKNDIIDKLALEEVRVFQKSFARANLSYSVFHLENKREKLLEILKNVPGSGIVYVRSRKQTEELAAFLQKEGVSALHYHAGLNGEERSVRQDRWVAGSIRVMVATNAFGMGIDKPDVRTVIHMDMPDSLEAYYQEAGRAGRDEKKAYAVLLKSPGDADDLMRRTAQSAVSADLIRRVYQALANQYKLAVGSNAMTSYDFDYQDFVANYNLPHVESFHAINRLVDEGFIQLNDAFKEKSKIHFKMPQPEVYKYQVANQKMDAIIKVLMRLYGGELFSNFISIKEADIAKLLNAPEVQVVNQLKYLDQAEVITYQYASGQPKITFLTPRYEANDLPINHEQIEWRRKLTESKAKSVIAYADSSLKCRTQMIQRYFDENAFEACGVCDVCIHRKKKVQSLPLKEIKSFIGEEPRNEQSLLSHFSKLNENELVSSLRELMDRKEIRLNDQEFFEVYG